MEVCLLQKENNLALFDNSTLDATSLIVHQKQMYICNMQVLR